MYKSFIPLYFPTLPHSSSLYTLLTSYNPTSSLTKLPITFFAHSVCPLASNSFQGSTSPLNSCNAKYLGAVSMASPNWKSSSVDAAASLNRRERTKPGARERTGRCSSRYHASKSASEEASLGGWRAAEMTNLVRDEVAPLTAWISS